MTYEKVSSHLSHLNGSKQLQCLFTGRKQLGNNFHSIRCHAIRNTGTAHRIRQLHRNGEHLEIACVGFSGAVGNVPDYAEKSRR